jgi:hypothetical protein
MWQKVAWTDECSFTTGAFGKIYVTRRADEKYDSGCLVPKFRGYSSCMIYGTIASSFKGSMVIYPAEIKINAALYIKLVVPGIHAFYRQINQRLGGGVMRAILMEDGCSVHTAKATKAYHAYYGVKLMT